MQLAAAIQDVHDRCAIYTSASTAGRLLDLIDWAQDVDLSSSVLLEPCVGEGAILLEAARRLLESLTTADIELTPETLFGRIRGFEFHAATAAVARCNAEKLLASAGVSPSVAASVAANWVEEGDFLLTDVGRATHVAANPPYLRWSKLPRELADEYRERLPAEATRGDIAVAFLDRMTAWGERSTRISALVSDRWLFAQYGAGFLQRCCSRGWNLEVIDETPDQPFVRRVSAYSSIVRLSCADKGAGPPVFTNRQAARRLHAGLVARHGTLGEAGAVVRVGPALGCGKTYLVSPEEAATIESELIRSFVSRQNFEGASVVPPDTKCVVPYDRQGNLIRLADYPGFEAWASQHREKLSSRAQTRGGKHWWRTIDAIGLQWQEAPKLLIPELCRVPTAYMDSTDAIPAHSLYVVWPGAWPASALQRILNAGLLRLTAEAEAPRVSNGWFRFYKRFIVRTPVPRWEALSPHVQQILSSGPQEEFVATFFSLFGFEPDGLKNSDLTCTLPPASH